MKQFLWIFLLVFVTACSRHHIPPEISSLRDTPKPVRQRTETIVIDAGHGGKDTGAMSKRDHYEEKELTLATARMIQHSLQQLGYKTVMTRQHDAYISLRGRAEIANAIEGDLFVSIHYNHAPSESAKGIEVYHYKESPQSKRIVASKVLAQDVLKRVVTLTGGESRGVKEANFAVIRETKMPAILVEAGFLSNARERECIHDPKYQRKIAWGIARGVDAYLDR